MRMTLLVLVPLLSGLVCWPLRERAVVERLNLLAFAIVAVLAAWEELGAGDVATTEHLANIAERGSFDGAPPDGTASFESGRAMLRAGGRPDRDGHGERREQREGREDPDDRPPPACRERPECLAAAHR